MERLEPTPWGLVCSRLLCFVIFRKLPVILHKEPYEGWELLTCKSFLWNSPLADLSSVPEFSLFLHSQQSRCFLISSLRLMRCSLLASLLQSRIREREREREEDERKRREDDRRRETDRAYESRLRDIEHKER